MRKTTLLLAAIASSFAPASRAEFPETLIHPGVTLKVIPLGNQDLDVTGVSFFPDGRMLLTSTDYMAGGEVPEPLANSVAWIVSGVQGDLTNVTMKKVANMFRQPIGAVATPEGKAYVSDRDGFYELQNIENPGDLAGNRRKVISYPWQGAPNTNFTKGNSWHQWCFTPAYYKGRFYAPYSGSIQPGGASAVPATSPMSGSFVSWSAASYDQPYTAMEKLAGGLRSPNGGNVDADGNFYYADNQGSWVPSSTFIHVRKGFFYGHRQTGNPANWAEGLPYEPPTAWLPHGRVRKSPTQPLFLDRGYYRGDWLLGDINDPGLLRIGIDKADGDNDRQNGAVFFFTGGFGTAGLNRMAWNSKENSIVVAPFGTINGNWPDPEKRKPTWKMTIDENPDVFEMKSIRSRAGGILIEFTKPVDKATAGAGAFTVTQWLYHRTQTYGCCQDPNEPRGVAEVQFSNDGKGVFLKINGLKNNHPGGAVTDYLTDVKLGNIKSAAGASLFYNEAWYTLNYQSAMAFDPAATTDIKPEALARVEKALTWRREAGGLAVSVDLEGGYAVELADVSGRAIASRIGRGAARFTLPTGDERGIRLLRIRQGGFSRSQRVML
jgi:hypothetical protein